jgi:hypothetical protein
MTSSTVSGSWTEKKRCHALKSMGVKIGNPIPVKLTEPLISNAELDETPIRCMHFGIDSDDVPVKPRRNLFKKSIEILRIAVYHQFHGSVGKVLHVTCDRETSCN